MTQLRPTFDAALQEAERLLREGEPRQALARCSDLLTSYPDAVRPLRLRAQAFDALSNFQRAAADYARVLEIIPTDVASMVNLALCLQDLHKHAEALTLARQALEYEPLNDDALRLVEEGGEDVPERGRLLRLRQKFEAGSVRKAIAELSAVAETETDRPDLQQILAEWRARSDAPIAAAETCQRLLDDQPDCLVAHALLTQSWARAGAEVLAIEHRLACARLDPDFRALQTALPATPILAPIDVPALVDPPARLATEPDTAEHAAYVDSLIAPLPLPLPGRAGEESALDDDPVEDVQPLSWERADPRDEPLTQPEWLRALAARQAAEPTGLDADDEDATPSSEAVARALGGTTEDRQTVEVPTVGDAAEPGLDPPPPLPPRPRKRKARTGAVAPQAEASAGDGDELSPLDWKPAGQVDGGEQTPPPVARPVRRRKAAAASVTPASDRTPEAAASPLEVPVVGLVADVPTEPPSESPDAVAPPAAMTDDEAATAKGKGHKKKGKKGKGKKGDKRGRDRVAADILEEDDDGLLDLARLAVEDQDFDRAERYFAAFIERGRRVDRALPDLEEITQTRPQRWHFWQLLGKLHTRKGRVSEALAAYQRALERM
ncbi:MAG: tetratricopeptide repeat protein [Thermoflexales bacterium]|nr:tetratricopeptide repeat protein [Thermoflexales bacterium]